MADAAKVTRLHRGSPGFVTSDTLIHPLVDFQQSVRFLPLAVKPVEGDQFFKLGSDGGLLLRVQVGVAILHVRDRTGGEPLNLRQLLLGIARLGQQGPVLGDALV